MKSINWNQLSELGLVVRINREILHPLGLAVFRTVETGVSEGALISDDGSWEYSLDIKGEVHSKEVIQDKLSKMETEDKFTMNKPIKSRKEAAEYINSGEHLKEKLNFEWKSSQMPHHFGKHELRKIMDFIYGGEPKDNEKIKTLGD